VTRTILKIARSVMIAAEQVLVPISRQHNPKTVRRVMVVDGSKASSTRRGGGAPTRNATSHFLSVLSPFTAPISARSRTHKEQFVQKD